ncbi:MAG: hypothetical protein H6505_03280 [Calditrichaeota bacterium]|nr:hypothetical protein [Calditrichota bacterium]
MAFTDLATVRKHLVASNLPETEYENVPITLHGTTQTALPDALSLLSVSVKWLADELPTLEDSIVLQDEKESSLLEKRIVPNSFLAASTPTLAQLYLEEHDYRVDYDNGLLRRLASGSIPNSVPVAVWYQYFEEFSDGTDYVVDYTRGTVRRTTGSAIPDGATVLLDYIIAQGTAEDVLIEQAIVEAQDIIVRSLREGYTTSSTDQGLKTGAINLALSIVARGMAALMLTRNTGSDAYSRAREWQQLSDKWLAVAWNVLAPFVRPNAMRSIVVE